MFLEPLVSFYYFFQYTIIEDICVSSARPAIFLYSRNLKRVVLVEHTVQCEKITL